jgi:ribosomal protein L11 methyltransferase
VAGLLQISVAVDTEGAEAVCSLFNELNRPMAAPDGTPHAGGSRAVIEATGFPDDADLEPHEVTMDMAQALRVKTFVAPGPDAETVVQRIREGLYWLSRLHPVSEPVVEVVEDKDWQEAWKEHYAAFAVGRSFLIQPSWDEAGATPAGRHVLRLNPGMAFGTGLHPSTRLCLVLLEGLGMQGARVLDVGTGSGILALGALKLGAARVVATDTDQTALPVVAENASYNDVACGPAGPLVPFAGSLPPPAEFDVVVVNILPHVIVSLLDRDALAAYVASGGCLVLSGIIDQRRAEVVDALQRHGFKVSAARHEEDWVALLAVRA